MWNKIVNPETGRKVNINGIIGKRIIKNYFNNLYGGSRKEIRLDEGEPYDFYSTIEDADRENEPGTEFNLGEMPVGAWFTYDNYLYRFVRYVNGFNDKPDLIIGKDKENREYIFDPTENAIYWGKWENTPQ